MQPTQRDFSGQQSALASESVTAGVVACVLLVYSVRHSRLNQENRHVNRVWLPNLLGLSEADKQGQHTVMDMHVSYRRCSNSHVQHDWWCQYHVWLGTKHDQAAADNRLELLRSLACVSMHTVVVMTEKGHKPEAVASIPVCTACGCAGAC